MVNLVAGFDLVFFYGFFFFLERVMLVFYLRVLLMMGLGLRGVGLVEIFGISVVWICEPSFFLFF